MNNLPEWWPYDKPYAIMDCLEGMRELPDKCVDLVLTDPPYGIGASNDTFMRVGKQTGKSLCKSGLKYTPSNWDDKTVDLSECFRVGKEQIIFGGNYYSLPPSSSWIVWDKDNSDNKYADCELAWTSHKKAVRKIKWKWHGMLQEDMKNKEERYHPTQKPIQLFIWILENYSKPGDIILDPFLGSGTTLRACRETGRIGLGFEIEKDYESIIKKRMMEEIPKLDRWF